MIDAARQGKIVVRLKGGDPLVFGRGGEEAQALREAGIPFEIVPGVTAALGAAAYSGIPLTHRHHASAVAFVTGHEDPNKPETLLNWASLAHFSGTLVFYMGMKRLEKLTQSLLDNGKPPTTPSAVIQWATRGTQRTVEGTLANIASNAAAAGLVSPAVMIIGSVVSLRQTVSWFESRPLFGKRVLVTRPAGQELGLVRRLEALGAEVWTQPTVFIEPPPSWQPVDDTLGRLPEFSWVVFTSVNGVHHFLRRLLNNRRDLRALGHLRLAAIGPATAQALRDYHLEADVVPSSFRSEDLAATLIPLVTGQRVLLARADRGREILRETLAAAASVEQIAVYSQKDVATADPEIVEVLKRGDLDFILLTSSNIAKSLARMLHRDTQAALKSGRTSIVSISPVTSEAITNLGWPVAVEAQVFTTEGMIEAMLDLPKS
jgi:uroporphyrinogen III methyltransferase/synthase